MFYKTFDKMIVILQFYTMNKSLNDDFTQKNELTIYMNYLAHKW